MSKRSDTDSPSYDRNHLADVPLTRSIAQIARNIQLTALTSTVVERCKHSVLDWLGVTIAGAQEPAARLVREVMIDDTSSGFTTVIGCSGLQAGLLNGVTANGTASHALDFDDIMPSTGPGHPTAPVLPALVALAERDDMSGASVLAAYLAALETEARLSLLVWPGHYRAGWHTTATIGTFGAAAGCAHLLGLDLDTWQVTLGIAGTQAAGLRLMFGTMCKPFHVGKAASNGLLAALLAKRGFTSNPDVLEAEQGFCWTQSDTLDLEDA